MPDPFGSAIRGAMTPPAASQDALKRLMQNLMSLGMGGSTPTTFSPGVQRNIPSYEVALGEPTVNPGSYELDIGEPSELEFGQPEEPIMDVAPNLMAARNRMAGWKNPALEAMNNPPDVEGDFYPESIVSTESTRPEVQFAGLGAGGPMPIELLRRLMQK